MAQIANVEESIAYRNFERGLRKKAQATKENYRWCIKTYMKWAGAATPDDLLQGDNVAIEDKIMLYIDQATQKEKLASGSIRMKLSALRLFYGMNRRPLSWEMIDQTVQDSEARKDRAYTKEEIRKILSVADIRVRAIVLLLISSGVRLGGLPRLKVSSLKPFENIYMVRVYEDTDDFYYTFCSPEARAAIDDYLELRWKAGEERKPDSPLFRLEFDSQNKTQVADVKPVNEGALKKTIQRITFVAGIRNRVSLNQKYSSETCSLAGKTRHEVKQVHGFRKFFNTTCKNAGMNQEFKEFMMGHDCGLDENYWDDENVESVKAVMTEYLKVVDQLSIGEEKQLRAQVVKLKAQASDLDTIKKSYIDMKLEFEKKEQEMDMLLEMAQEENSKLENELEQVSKQSERINTKFDAVMKMLVKEGKLPKEILEV